MAWNGESAEPSLRIGNCPIRPQLANELDADSENFEGALLSILHLTFKTNLDRADIGLKSAVSVRARETALTQTR